MSRTPPLSSLRKAVGLIAPARRKRWVLVLLLAIGGAGVEMGATLLVFTLLAALTGSSISIPFVGALLDRLVSDGDEVVVLALVVAGFYVFRSVYRVAQRYIESRVAYNEGVLISRRLLAGYLRMPYHMHLHRNSGEMIKNAFSTTDQFIIGYLNPLVRIISETLVSLAVVGVLVATAPLVTAVAVVVLGGGAFAVLRLVQPRIRRLGFESEQANHRAVVSLQESLRGLRDIKLLGREDFFLGQFARHRRTKARAKYVLAGLSEIPRYTLETLLVVGLVTVLILTQAMDGSGGSLALLGLFGYAAFRLMPSGNRIMTALNQMRFSDAPINILLEEFAGIERGLEEEPDRGRPISFERELRFDQVSYRYPQAEEWAIRDVSLMIRPGEYVGVVGPTGGGKSTLLDLVTGLIHPTEGRVLIDGVDLRDCARAWQRILGTVPQRVFLIDDTLRRNIALGVPEREIDEDRLHQVVQIAQLEEVVEDLPDGLDTRVGESGIRLSGGQRQRVAIARALYQDAEALILDEGTAALDSITESELMRALGGLRGSHTVIHVAHRLATVQDCDRILLVSEGRIVDSGSFSELVDRNEMFARMAG